MTLNLKLVIRISYHQEIWDPHKMRCCSCFVGPGHSLNIRDSCVSPGVVFLNFIYFLIFNCPFSSIYLCCKFTMTMNLDKLSILSLHKVQPIILYTCMCVHRIPIILTFNQRFQTDQFFSSWTNIFLFFFYGHRYRTAAIY